MAFQWLVQSHLSTEDYAEALKGLRRTRQFHRITLPLRRLDRAIEDSFFSLIAKFVGLFGFSFRTQKSVRWTKDTPIQTPSLSFHNAEANPYDRHGSESSEA